MAGDFGLRELRDEERGGEVVCGHWLSEGEGCQCMRSRVGLVRSGLAEGALYHGEIVVCIRAGIFNWPRCWHLRVNIRNLLINNVAFNWFSHFLALLLFLFLDYGQYIDVKTRSCSC